MNKLQRVNIFALGVALALASPVALAEGSVWHDTAEFGFVGTDGNTESTSLSANNVLWRDWENAKLTFRAGAIRVEGEIGRSVVGNEIVIQTDTTAEAFYLNGRYDRNITERFFWYGGAGWDRNEFAGIKNRYIYEGGVGNIWRDTDDVKFRTNYGITYTDQEDVVQNPDPTVDDTFFGWRAGWDYANKLTGTTSYTNTLVLDGNADETSDWRGDMTNGLAVAMSEKLSLKVGLRLMYDNEPSFQTIAPNPPIQLEELDTILTASLVVNFK